jgi:tRNA-binding EMAP/Myf-like protein
VEGVVVGKVVKVRPHPRGERIWLADVDIGADYQLQIVWGGLPIVQEGSLVPVALPGARLPDGKLRRRRYRGEISEGMLCSLAELGWDPSVTDRVALLDNSIGLRPGESLVNRDIDWESIVMSVDKPPMMEVPTSNSLLSSYRAVMV